MKVCYESQKTQYIEEGQKNPLRWVGLKKKDNVWVNTTDKFKCKDFLNDLAYTVNSGRSLNIYNMDTSVFCPAANKGFYILLVSVTEHLGYNIKQVLNPYIKTTLGVKVDFEYVDPKDVEGINTRCMLLYLPRKAFKTTFHIALISGLIRNLNVDKPFSSFKEFFTPDVAKDLHLDDARYHLVREGDFSFLPFDKYYWYANADTNSETYPIPQTYHYYTIHENGIMGYTQQLLWESKYAKDVEMYQVVKNDEYDEYDDYDDSWDDEYVEDEEEENAL